MSRADLRAASGDNPRLVGRGCGAYALYVGEVPSGAGVDNDGDVPVSLSLGAARRRSLSMVDDRISQAQCEWAREIPSKALRQFESHS